MNNIKFKLILSNILTIILFYSCSTIDYIVHYYEYDVYNSTTDTIYIEASYSLPLGRNTDSTFIIYPHQKEYIYVRFPSPTELEGAPSKYIDSIKISNSIGELIYKQCPIQDSLWQVVEKIHIDNPRDAGDIIKYQFTYSNNKNN